ncbi:MAG: electron transfer flavoprotein subunit alpha/FixB family protein [Actinobacteria bacterium]|nr:electron transfer flavoprotein subunit alpha/FixB family protein [Actinomycetota bacterium]
MSNTWMVVAGDPAVGALVETGRAIGGELVALVVGPTSAAQAVAAGGVDRVVHLVGPQDAPYEAFAAAVAEQIAAAAPQIVLAADRPADRALAGAVAARTGAGLLGAVRQVEVVDGAVQVVRDALGGIVRERLAVAAPTVLVLDAGGPLDTGTPVEIVEVTAPVAAVRVVERNAAVVSGPDLRSARRVVAVGRGLREKDDVALAEQLAAAIDGATACSRPLAEGVGYFPRDRYVGVSGQQVTPDLYLAAGISGQVQHMVGARGARVIVAINTDKDASIFRECDYGVVGDLYELLPALTAALAR